VQKQVYVLSVIADLLRQFPAFLTGLPEVRSVNDEVQTPTKESAQFAGKKNGTADL
jgi:hypothetical protein